MSPLKHAAAQPIAIIGMGVRLPGGISTTDEFWNLLINKKDGRCRVPGDRYNVDAFHGDKTHRQNVATDYGYFLDANLTGFDTSFFGVNRAEIDVTDPQLRFLLEVVWECMENAGQTDLRGTNTGVFVGVFGEDWHNMLHRDSQMPHTYRVLSAGDYALSNVLSHEYNLTGPSMTIRTACSSSLSSLHIACQALYNGDCPTAIVAGSSVIMDPSMAIDMSEQGVLSPTGSCKTFDAAADGFARGEAVNALLIKPLEDALRDGDPIRGVIRSTAVNSDGKTSHIGSPSTEAQVALIRRAYEAAGIKDVSQTPFVECHGTGTVRGDPIEVAAVAKVFEERGAYIGSVKPNLGHGEGAAALTSIIKAVLALENEMIPPNINFSTPNPNIPFEEYKLEVPVEPIPWPKDRCARVSINSFGIGGANGHVIIDSAASFGIRRTMTHNVLEQSSEDLTGLNGQTSDSASDSSFEKITMRSSVSSSDVTTSKPFPILFPISASTEKSLQARVDGLEKYIKARPGAVNDVAYTQALRRVCFSQRAFCIAKPDEDPPLLDFSPAMKTSVVVGKNDKIVFVFTGQGAQWSGMGKSLVQSCATFLQDIRQMDYALQQLGEDAPSWKIEELLGCTDNSVEKAIDQAELAQPLCTAIQVALVKYLEICGITPNAVIGHSSGEIAAAYCAGVMTMSEAITCAYFRGLATKHQSRNGSMAAIGMGRDDMLPYLVDGVQIACENSPKSVTISGDLGAVDKVLEAIKTKDPDLFTRKLQVNIAYHSHHMREIGDIYEKMLQPHVLARETLCPFYSTVLGKVVTADDLINAEYWRRNLESPVLFNSTMKHLVNELPDVATILEIGPHSALKGPIRQILQTQRSKQTPDYLPTIVRDKDCSSSILATVGQLFARGHAVNFRAICPDGSLLTDLPPYPWDRGQDFWRESRLSQAWRHRKHPHHEILGSRCLEASDLEPMWRNVFYQYDVAWLGDHKVNSNVVFPVAGFISMMGEAIRQFVGSDGYVLRNVQVKSALIMSETDAIEVITSMKPLRLTGLTNSSSWYELSISSFTGVSWVESCVAQGKGIAEDDKSSYSRGPANKVMPHKRKVPGHYFYDRMQYLGLRYGPRFQGLRDISCHTDKEIAVATIHNDESEYAATYAVHPTTIDCCLQLGAVANCKGLARNLDTLALPIEIQNITIRPGGSSLLVEAKVNPGEGTASCIAVTEQTGQVSVKISNGRGIPFDTGDYGNSKNALHAARVEWLPDIDCAGADGLIRPARDCRPELLACERGALATILQMWDVVGSLDISHTGHLAKYVSWLERERKLMISGDRDHIIPEAQQWLTMDVEARQTVLDSFMKQVEDFDDVSLSGIARMVYRLAGSDTIKAVFTGTMNPLEVLLEDDGLKHFYDMVNSVVSIEDFAYLSGHSKPNMRILEVGAGTGGTSEMMMRSMKSGSGVRMYSRYYFTDISSGFFPFAKERFEGLEGIEYKVLDIEKDPEEQGFELGSFDLIVASNVLHATSSLHNCLQNVRALLRPGGRLLLHELVPPMNWRCINLITGLLPGWWTGELDNRTDVPCVSVERWNQELRAAGFSGTDTVAMDDSDTSYAMCAYMTSTAVVSDPETKPLTFLYLKEKHEFGLRLAKSIEEQGILVQWTKLGDQHQFAEAEDVISTIDLEEPYFHEITESDYVTFQKYISTFKGGLLWLTRSAQLGCTDPRYGVSTGLMRTIRLELNIPLWIAELQRLDTAGLNATCRILEKFQVRSAEVEGLIGEFAVLDGVVHLGRYHWTPMVKEIEPPSTPNNVKQLVIGRFGSIDSLQWEQHESAELQDDEIEMQIHCVGLNFKDIMVTAGIVTDSKYSLGSEAAGVVTRVGAAVDAFKVGDRVSTMWPGMFTTRKVMPARYVLPIPDHLSFEEAATIPAVYTTVVYALMILGKLEKGQTILIHSATGGVGQAAINLSQMLGAEIYATVGNEEKVDYLVANHNLPRERIFNSHNDSFLDDVMEATDGRGVDLVLNSLSGDLLHASWQCVAKAGKMMEIGKRDILEHGRLALDMFQNNRTFHGIDMRDLYLDSRFRDEFSRLLDQLHEFGLADKLKCIQPIHTFPVQELSKAMRFMKKGQHMGKIIITMPQDATDLPATMPHEPSLLSSTSTYLMIGGLGGLGKEVARWMVEKGARSFCFLSRSVNDNQKHQAFLHELESQGCRVAAVEGSVANLADVEKAVAAAPTPIVGVLQMSMVLKDLPLLDIQYDDWRAVQDPKVRGTWNLHKVLDGVELDFFILFSSIVGVTGQPGQANYASANTFLDSFMQYRHNLGLPCSVIDLGGMEGIGFLTTRPDKLNQYRSSGLYFLQEEQLMEAVRVAIRRSSPADGLGPVGHHGAMTAKSQITVGLRSRKALSDPRSTRLFTGDTRFSLYINLDPNEQLDTESRDEELEAFLKEVEDNPDVLDEADTLPRVSWEIGRTLFKFLSLPEEDLDISLTLESIGVDSLASIEIRNWWRRKLGLEITVLEILNSGTIEGLGKRALSSLKDKYKIKGSSGGDKDDGADSIELITATEDAVDSDAPPTSG